MVGNTRATIGACSASWVDSAFREGLRESIGGAYADSSAVAASGAWDADLGEADAFRAPAAVRAGSHDLDRPRSVAFEGMGDIIAAKGVGFACDLGADYSGLLNHAAATFSARDKRLPRSICIAAADGVRGCIAADGPSLANDRVDRHALKQLALIATEAVTRALALALSASAGG